MRELKRIAAVVEISVGTEHPHAQPPPPHQFNLEFKEYVVCEALSKQISPITSNCLMYTRCLNLRENRFGDEREKIFSCFPLIVQLYFLVNYKTKMFKFK